MKKLALLFSHPDVTLWARLLPWGHFVIFHSETGSPADTLSQDWENLHKLTATRGPLQSASAHTELPHGLCLVTDVCTCVCPAQHGTWLWAWQMPSKQLLLCCQTLRMCGHHTQLLSELGLATPGPGLSQTRLRSLMSLWVLATGKRRVPRVTLTLMLME